MRHLLLAALGLLLAAELIIGGGCSINQTVPPMNEPSRPMQRALAEMGRRDQEVRRRLFRGGKLESEAVKKMLAVDAANQKRLRELVLRHGEINTARAGRDGIRSLFLIVQHADIGFQEEFQPYIERAVVDGGLTKADLALLTDRMRLRKGQKQLYGSQFQIVDGQIIFDPIEDEANVDKRRAEVGLPTLEEYERLAEQETGLKPRP